MVKNGKKRFEGQSFKRLLSESNAVGLTFSDQLFKCEDKSVALTSQYRTQLDVGKIVWKRPKELVEIPHFLYSEKLGPAQDIEFGGDGPNKWFIAASLAITTDKNVLYKVIPKSQTHFLRGILKFNFWHLGQWTKVVVDDRLPTFDNQLVFSRSHSKLVYWVPLLEKAYAKLHGSYETMATNGCLESALMDMTGAIVETITLEKEGKEREQLRMISEELNKNAIICAKSKESLSSQNTYRLVGDSIYIIKNIKKPSTGTFRKTFSKDNSKESVSIRLMSTIADNKTKTFSVNSQTDYRLQDFWISIEEFCRYFDSITICRTYSSDRISVAKGNLSSQFCFDVNPDFGEIIIDLMQTKCKEFVCLGFNLYKVEVNRSFKIHNLNRSPIVLTVEAIKSRNIVKRIELSCGRYVLTPICSNPDLPLILRINKSSNLKILSQDMPRKHLFPFVSPKYPKFVTRITIISANSLQRLDRFGAANPYCVIRCGRQVVKSSPISETLSPEWNYFSAIFYHNRFVSIIVELWHQSLLIDYFMGRVEVLPKINTNSENSTSIQELELYNRKKEPNNLGSLKLQVFTYEDLRAF